MNQEFNHAANDSPRSGSSKQVTPVVWCAVIVTAVALVIPCTPSENRFPFFRIKP
jgi:hypothetical protein